MLNSSFSNRLVEALPDEGLLVRQAKSGDVNSFAQLYDAYVERVYGYIYFLVPNNKVAEGLTLQVFFKAWGNFEKHQKLGQSFVTCLYAIAQNQISTYRETHKQDTEPRGVSLFKGVDAKEEFQALRMGLRYLPTDQQQALVLKFILGMSTKHIAQTIAKTENNIYELQAFALQALAEYFLKAPKFEPANEFLTILEDSVAKLSSGVMTVDQCVMLYPNYAEPLKLILQTTFFLRLGYGLQPSSTFIAYTRAALLQHMWSHPRQQKKVVVMPFGQRMAVTLAMLFAALLATGTAHAQSALPGDNFYPWKRTSEQVWRTLSLDPVATDIAIANRRVVEMVAVADDPVLSASARDGYFEVLNRLSSVDDVPTLATILPALVTQEAALSDAGVVIPELEDLLVVVTNAIPDEVLAQLTTTATATSTLTTTPEFTFTPTSTPTEQPTDTPTMTPTPTDEPTNTPTMSPTATDEPTDTPTMTPTATDEPTNTPTDEPTLTPTDTPTDEPTLTPTYTPTDEPTITPTDTLDPSLIPADGLP